MPSQRAVPLAILFTLALLLCEPFWQSYVSFCALPSQSSILQQERTVRGAVSSKEEVATLPQFLPTKAVLEVEEQAALNMARALRTSAVTMPTGMCSRAIQTSYYCSPGMTSATPLVVLLHGFDSSCLEWRRLAPALETQGVGVLAMDLLGWGFTERPQDVECDFSADAKLRHLEGLLESVLTEQGKRPVALIGTSLGAAFAVGLALARPDLIDGLVLMSPQVYVDGIGPMANLPRPAASLGVGVLGSEPLRSVANWLSYADPVTFATEDAMRIGRLSVLTQGWADSTVDYMLSGGIAVSERIQELSVPVLGIFGRQDGIVEPAPVADRLMRDLSSGNTPVDVRWVEDCGHVPHLEQPAATAGLLTEWLLQQGLLVLDVGRPKL